MSTRLTQLLKEFGDSYKEDSTLLPCDELIELLKQEDKILLEREKRNQEILELKEPKITLPEKPEKIKTVEDLLITFLHQKNNFQVIALDEVKTTENYKHWYRKIFLSQKQLSWLYKMIMKECGDRPCAGWSFNISDNLMIYVDNHRWGITVNVVVFAKLP